MISIGLNGYVFFQVCEEAFNDAPQMGGIGEVVQIDESLFRGKRKYNRGRL